MAASPHSATIAIGCEDGCARLFRYGDSSDTLEYHRALPMSSSKSLSSSNKPVRVLSIAYHPLDSRIFMGCSDGTIRCLDEV